jgi:hypothetical protein
MSACPACLAVSSVPEIRNTCHEPDPGRLACVHADPGPGDAAERDAAEREKAHRAFRRVSVGGPELEVDTSDGYHPPFGQILSFITEGIA